LGGYKRTIFVSVIVENSSDTYSKHLLHQAEDIFVGFPVCYKRSGQYIFSAQR